MQRSKEMDLKIYFDEEDMVLDKAIKEGYDLFYKILQRMINENNTYSKPFPLDEHIKNKNDEKED